ncbi:MAG: tetratricopeptide repeat-containing sensor histidine kinase [Carboxylicivirga sp.]|nr:tetratricopeptide repeat-containing sensor histidine kinase [Carboxylicivirga sp.]
MRIRIITVMVLMPFLVIKSINVDSLKNRINHCDQEEQLIVYEQLLEHYFYSNLDTAMHYAYLLRGHAEVLNQSPSEMKALMSLALLFHLKGEPARSRELIAEGDSIVNGAVNARAHLIYNFYKGAHKLYISELDSALLYLDRSLNLGKQLADKKLAGRSLLNIGNVYFFNGNYTLALKYYQQCVEYLEEIGDNRGKVYVLFNIANIYRHRSEIEQGLKYYDEAYNLARDIGDNVMQGNVMNNKALAHASLNENDSALAYINQAIEYYELVGATKQLIQAHCNKARYLLYLNQPDSVAYYLNLVQTECEIDKYPRAHVNYLVVKAEYYRSINKNQEAIDCLTIGLGKAKEYKQDDNKLTILHQLASNEATLKNWKMAYEYADEASYVQDSVYDLTKVEAMAFLQKAFDLMKKEKETELHRAKNQLLELELRNERQSSFIIVLIAILLAVITLVTFIIFLNNRQKKNELAETNLQLKQSNQDLVDANKVKNKLISVLSHDLKSPLSSIVSMSSLAEMSPTIKEKSDLKIINAMSEASNMMLSFIDNTLLWFKKIHGNLKPDYQQLSVKFIMDETAFWFKSFSKLKEISLNFDGEDITIENDKNILLVMMRNLVSNAIKFSDNGQSVNVTWYVTNNEVTIKVSDSGTGMSEEQVKAINESGTNQSTFGTHGETGSGLGLFLCQELLLSIGGRLWVNSKEGEGTDVFCTLKIKV